VTKGLGIKKRKIGIWLVPLVIITLVLVIIDICIIQPNAIHGLENYSDIILVIWQVQATLTTLVIALLALIIGRLEDSYYGIPIKELLSITSNNKIWLNFWEIIIYVLLMNVCTCISVVGNSLLATSVMWIISTIFIIKLLIECIDVINKSEKYKKKAKEYINGVIEDVLKDPKTRNVKKEMSKMSVDTKRKRGILKDIIFKMENELKGKILSGELLIEDDTQICFSEINEKFKYAKDIEFYRFMDETLCIWMRTAIKFGSMYNVIELFHISANNKSSNCVDILFNFYYKGQVDEKIILEVIEIYEQKIEDNLSECKEIVLGLLRRTILNSDKDIFTKLVKAIWNNYKPNESQDKGDILLAILAYLYCVNFNENKFVENNSQEFVNQIIFKNEYNRYYKDILTRSDVLFEGSRFLFEIFDDDLSKYDYLTHGKTQFVYLKSDIAEFFSCYCIMFFKNNGNDKNIFDNLKLDSIKLLKDYVDEDGGICSNFCDKFKRFFKWIGFNDESDKKNLELSEKLNIVLKKKLLEEAIKIREDSDILKNTVDEFKIKILENAKQSSLYDEESQLPNCNYNNTYEYTDIFYRDLFLKNNYYYYVYENKIINDFENELFKKSKKFIDQVELNNHDNDRKISTEIEAFKENDVLINCYYNNIPNKLESKLNYCGPWNNEEKKTIYIDKRKWIPGFYIRKDFFELKEDLTDEEINEELESYKNGEKYSYSIYNSSIVIDFEKDELKDYLKILLFKISFKTSFRLPKEKVGFFTNSYIENKK
jgi:hypothetical protein